MFFGLIIRAPPRRMEFPRVPYRAFEGQLKPKPNRMGLADVWTVLVRDTDSKSVTAIAADRRDVRPDVGWKSPTWRDAE